MCDLNGVHRLNTCVFLDRCSLTEAKTTIAMMHHADRWGGILVSHNARDAVKPPV